MNAIKPIFSSAEMDKYLVKSALLSALKRDVKLLTGSLLDVGCGEAPYRDTIMREGRVSAYTGLDLPSGKYFDQRQPDATWDGVTIPFDAESFDCAICLEVLEHTYHPQGVLAEIKRILRPGGYLIASVPFLWPLHDAPHDHYRYTPFFFEKSLAELGFSEHHITALGGWDASMAQMLALWINRRPMSNSQRRLTRTLLTPFVRWLSSKDVGIEKWQSDQMFTGLWIVARAPSQ